MTGTKKNNETWRQYAKRCDYYRESTFDGRWIIMTKKEIIEYEIEYEEILKQNKEMKIPARASARWKIIT